MGENAAYDFRKRIFITREILAKLKYYNLHVPWFVILKRRNARLYRGIFILFESESKPMNTVEELSTREKILKLIRFVRIYSFSRALSKMLGRLQGRLPFIRKYYLFKKQSVGIIGCGPICFRHPVLLLKPIFNQSLSFSFMTLIESGLKVWQSTMV